MVVLAAIESPADTGAIVYDSGTMLTSVAFCFYHGCTFFSFYGSTQNPVSFYGTGMRFGLMSVVAFPHGLFCNCGRWMMAYRMIVESWLSPYLLFSILGSC